MRLAHLVAEEIAARVDEILGQRAAIGIAEMTADAGTDPGPGLVCSCQGGGLPARTVQVAGVPVTLVALEPIFQRFVLAEVASSEKVGREIMQMVKVYNAIPPEQEEAYAEAVWREFVAYRAAGGWSSG